VNERLPACARGKPLEVWFQDEARVGQQGTLTRIWARRGSRPPAPRDQRHHWAYIFGAVCPARTVGAALVLPTVNAELMSLHLAEISKCVAAGAHAILILDGAVHAGEPAQPSRLGNHRRYPRRMLPCAATPGTASSKTQGASLPSRRVIGQTCQ
jgi:hypothetical protein